MLAWLTRIGFGWLLLVTLSGCGNALALTPTPITAAGIQSNDQATTQPTPDLVPTITLTPELEVAESTVEPTPEIRPVHEYYGAAEACEVNYERLKLDPTAEALVQTAFEQTQLSGKAEVYGTADWQACSDEIAWIEYDFEVEVTTEVDQATLYQHAQVLHTLMQTLQNQPALQYPLAGATIYWRFGEHSCSWDYQYVTTINPDGNAWYLKYTSSTKQTDNDPVCEVAETPAPSNYCFPARSPQPLNETDLALIQAAIDQTQLTGQASGYQLRTGTSCNYQSTRLGYHFYIDAPTNATSELLEDRAHQLQTIVTDLRQHPSLDYPPHMLIITWRFMNSGCSWGYEYAEDAQGHVWYPRSSPYFGSEQWGPRCRHQEIVESTIPRPIDTPLYDCSGAFNFGTYPVSSQAEAQVTQALQQVGIDAMVKLRGNGEGTNCMYGIMNIGYSITLDRPTNADQAQLEQQVAIIQSILDQQQFDISVSSLRIIWRMDEFECVWLYTYAWKDGDFGWEFEEVWPYPCPQ